MNRDQWLGLFYFLSVAVPFTVVFAFMCALFLGPLP